MNDFERKLSQQPFRRPPPESRAAIFGVPRNVIVPPAWTWRDWLWPSPQAWAALAAVWLIFAVVRLAEAPLATPSSASAFSPVDRDAPTHLFTAYHTRDFRHVFESAN